MAEEKQLRYWRKRFHLKLADANAEIRINPNAAASLVRENRRANIDENEKCLTEAPNHLIDSLKRVLLLQIWLLSHEEED